MTDAVICLMGPTASGKTDVAIDLCKRFPCEIISVDSALVYRGMDIGTAKPSAEVLARTPHRLVDIRDPEQAYSAGEFVRDAKLAIDEILAAGRIPLLVGGTMMYFRALTRGIAQLPAANSELRATLDAEAAQVGWPALHRKLAEIDPKTAARIEANDSQRIQRALEVCRLSGQKLSDLQAAGTGQPPASRYEFIKLALKLEPRALLHKRIEQRLNLMLNNGFVDEVKVLRERPGLSADAASMRAVGYRQFWRNVAGECTFDDARYRALVATRQLAKRQMTWLRSEPGVKVFDPLEVDLIDAISGFLIRFLN